ncbi:hypothetical protein D3C75_1132270 [compost metagenome]
MDGRARITVQLPAQVIGPDVLGQVEPVAEVRRRPPLAVAGGQVDAGDGRVVGTDPAAQGDLADHYQQGQRSDPAQAQWQLWQGRKGPGQTQGQQEQQAQGSEAAE